MGVQRRAAETIGRLGAFPFEGRLQGLAERSLKRGHAERQREREGGQASHSAARINPYGVQLFCVRVLDPSCWLEWPASSLERRRPLSRGGAYVTPGNVVDGGADGRGDGAKENEAVSPLLPPAGAGEEDLAPAH